LVGDPGVLDGIGRIGVTELSLNRHDIAGFLDEMPAGRRGACVALDAGQAAYLVEHRIDHPGVETTVAVGVGGRRKKQRRRAPFFKILRPLLFNVILYRRQALAQYLTEKQGSPLHS